MPFYSVLTGFLQIDVDGERAFPFYIAHVLYQRAVYFYVMSVQCFADLHVGDAVMILSLGLEYRLGKFE